MKVFPIRLENGSRGSEPLSLSGVRRVTRSARDSHYNRKGPEAWEQGDRPVGIAEGSRIALSGRKLDPSMRLPPCCRKPSSGKGEEVT